MSETTNAAPLTAVQQAIAAAAAAQASQSAATAAPAPAAAAAPGTAVATTSTGAVTTAVAAPKMSMEDAMGSSLSVDAWMKVSEDGIKIGESPVLIDGDPIHVVINMTDGIGFVVKNAIKGGNPAQYAYTQDNVTATTGGSWEAAQAKIRSLPGASGASPYRAVDLPMRVPKDIVVSVLNKATKQPEDVVVCPAGKTLGHTTSTTNWKAWELLYREVSSKGYMGQEILVNVGYEKRKNAGGNTWGTLTFQLIGLAAEELASE